MNEENTPVIVGVAQLVDREATVRNHIEPLEMLTRTCMEAAGDAGSIPLVSKVDTIATVGVSGWHPQNAPGLVGERLGAYPARCYTTGIGGQVGIYLLNFVAEAIVSGESELALVAGCNNLRVLMKAIAEKVQLTWARGGAGTAELIGGDEAGNNDLEDKYGMKSPTEMYPLFENALRAKRGLDFASHRERMGRLFEGFTRVAAGNPYAWFPTYRSADELTTVTPENRMISFPYPKYLNAILNTEQAAAVLMTSVAKARQLSIPEPKWVYWWGGAHSQEEAWWVSERPNFTECPSMKDTALSALHNAGIGLDDVSHFDFYSCFPSAVQMACEMLDLDVADPRGFTVTGGLPYAGGPASAYTLHSAAAMVEKLRASRGDIGFLTGNGWYLSKHSATVLSSAPKPGGEPANGLMADLPSRGMVTDARVPAASPAGGARIETYTVNYDREGRPFQGVVVGETDEGERFVANTPDDLAFLEDFVTEEQVGRRGIVASGGERTIFSPE